jgi:hypothetical protein
MEADRSSRARAYRIAVKLEQKEIQLQELNSRDQALMPETDSLEKQVLAEDINNLKKEFYGIVTYI